MTTRSLTAFQKVAGQAVLDEIQRLAERLNGISCLHVNSQAAGGPSAELLSSLVPLLNEAGLAAEWRVFEGTKEFFRVTRLLHDALHGQPVSLTTEDTEIFLAQAAANRPLAETEHDFVVLHDHQPLGLATHRTNHGRWLWYCHADPIEAQADAWKLLAPLIGGCDVALFHLPSYAKDLPCLQYFMPPAIDPLSDKNRPLSRSKYVKLLEEVRLADVKVPVILQVALFDRLKDPAGVIEAFQMVHRVHRCHLVMAGGGNEDPQGARVLNELLNMASGHPDITVLALDPQRHLLINALQRRANIVVEKSMREGFGLSVTEALWKAKPVVVSPTGGLAAQVRPNQSGLYAATSEDMARQILYLLDNPAHAARLGHNGMERVRRYYLLPVYLRNWLHLFTLLNRKTASH